MSLSERTMEALEHNVCVTDPSVPAVLIHILAQTLHPSSDSSPSESIQPFTAKLRPQDRVQDVHVFRDQPLRLLIGGHYRSIRGRLV